LLLADRQLADKSGWIDLRLDCRQVFRWRDAAFRVAKQTSPVLAGARGEILRNGEVLAEGEFLMTIPMPAPSRRPGLRIVSAYRRQSVHRRHGA